MRRFILLIIVGLSLLSGCGREQEAEKALYQPDAGKELLTDTTGSDIIRELSASGAAEDITEEAPANAAADNGTEAFVTLKEDGSIEFDLREAASVQIQSVPDYKGIKITDTQTVNEVSGRFHAFKPRTEGNDKPEYNYTLTFCDVSGNELVSLKVYENFTIGYDGVTYYDETEQLYIWQVRELYIEAIRDTFTYDSTSFTANGAGFNLKELDNSINAITNYTWFGSTEFPDPALFLECHISPKVGYGAVFDVEKMDFVFGAYGAPFACNSSAGSIVYAFEDSVYNYWGDILYQNNDKSVFIGDLEYDAKAGSSIVITLQSIQREESHSVTRLNYHPAPYSPEDYGLAGREDGELLAEFNADLTHDGADESITVSMIEAGGELIVLKVLNTAGEILWIETAHTAHAGWNTIYLCELDGKKYLLAFNPYQNTGTASFTYVLFHLTGPGTIETADSGYYGFSYGADEGTEGAFDEAVFRTFADQVNIYLKNSRLLMSTEGGEPLFSTGDNHLPAPKEYETDRWIASIRNSLY